MNKFKAASTVMFCEKCDYSCKTKGTLNRHIDNRHTGKVYRKLRFDDINENVPQPVKFCRFEDETVHDLEMMANSSIDGEIEDIHGKTTLLENEAFELKNDVDFDAFTYNNILNFLEDTSPSNTFGEKVWINKDYEDYITKGHFTLFCKLEKCSKSSLLPVCWYQPLPNNSFRDDVINEIVSNIVSRAAETIFNSNFLTLTYSSQYSVNSSLAPYTVAIPPSGISLSGVPEKEILDDEITDAVGFVDEGIDDDDNCNEECVGEISERGGPDLYWEYKIMSNDNNYHTVAMAQENGERKQFPGPNIHLELQLH